MSNRVSRIISDETLSRIIDIESAGNPTAKARTSSALGLGQFLNATWLKTVETHRPDLYGDYTRTQLLALRTDPNIAIEMLARFTEDNARILGPGFSDADLYLAHFSGVMVAKRLRVTSADALASTVYGRDAVQANKSILEGKTVGEVRAWAARKMAKAKTHWVAHFIAEQRLADLPADEPAQDAAPRTQPDDPGVEVEPQTGGGITGWLKRQWLKLTGGAGVTGLLGLFTEPRFWLYLFLAFVGSVLIAFGIALWLFGKARVGNWIARKLG